MNRGILGLSIKLGLDFSPLRHAWELTQYALHREAPTDWVSRKETWAGLLACEPGCPFLICCLWLQPCWVIFYFLLPVISLIPVLISKEIEIKKLCSREAPCEWKTWMLSLLLSNPLFLPLLSAEYNFL